MVFPMQKTVAQRDHGIDLLRVLAMAMIVLHHILYHGGLWNAYPKGSNGEAFMFLLQAAVCCAVNVYALISGYLRVRFRFSRILALWVQVLFWSVGLDVVFALFAPLPAVEWVEAFTPVLSNRNWYFTAYFGLFCLLPLLNHAIETLPRNKLLFVAAGCAVLFSLLPGTISVVPGIKASAELATCDPFGMSNGYHMAWIVTLYLLGSCVRQILDEKPVSRVRTALLYPLCVLVSWGVWLLESRTGAMHIVADALIWYDAPTMLIAALALLCAFCRLPMPRWAQRCVTVISPLTFGIYLIHDHALVRDVLMPRVFGTLHDLPPVQLVAALAGSLLAVFFGCALLEWLRKQLFGLLRVEQGCLWVERKARRLWARVCETQKQA